VSVDKSFARICPLRATKAEKNSLLNSLINSLFLKQQRNLSLLQHEKSIHGLAAPRDLLVSALLVNLNS